MVKYFVYFRLTVLHLRIYIPLNGLQFGQATRTFLPLWTCVCVEYFRKLLVICSSDFFPPSFFFEFFFPCYCLVRVCEPRHRSINYFRCCYLTDNKSAYFMATGNARTRVAMNKLKTNVIFIYSFFSYYRLDNH